MAELKNTMGNKTNTRKRQRGNDAQSGKNNRSHEDNPKWKKPYSEMTIPEAEKLLGRLENIKGVFMNEVLETHTLEMGGIKEKVYNRVS